MKNAFEYAMQMELESDKLYRDMAHSESDERIKTVLVMLADEEVKHYKAFKKMAETSDASGFDHFDISESVKKIFSGIKEDKKPYHFSGEQVEFYHKAAEIEDKAYEFYMQKAEEADDPMVKKAFLKIASEEKKHQELMENLAAFVAEPESWLESAEFNNIVS